jgi:hypothetical protein
MSGDSDMSILLSAIGALLLLALAARSGARPSGRRLTEAEIRALAAAAGFLGHDLDVAVRIAMRESGGDPHARALTPREDSRGLWQINTRVWREWNPDSLYDPELNARAAYTIWSREGWRPWSTYRPGE